MAPTGRGWIAVFWSTVVLMVAVTTAALGRAQQPTSARPPNILLLFADDQRADTIAAHGNPNIDTPNIDRLVRQGFSFHRNYVFGGDNGAVCVASRAMLMTGRNWFRLRTNTLEGSRLLPEYLADRGYVTFATGKWHNGQASWRQGFQHGRAIMFGGMSDHLAVPLRDRQPDGTLTDARTGDGFSTELFTDATIDFLRTQDGSRPFFAYVAFTAPHDPRQPPEPFRSAYYGRRPPVPGNFLPQHPFDNGMVKNLRDENLGAWPRTEAVIRDQLAEYYGLITHLDQQVGRILDTLEETGLADNTLVIYAADNGLALGSHGLLGKQSLYEHSVRTPLIVRGPGVPAGSSTQAFTYLHDLFPTLLDVAGVAAPPDLDAVSLRPVWEGRVDRVRDTLFVAYMQIHRAVRDDRWKLIAYPALHFRQLFDLQNDPLETRNVIAEAGNVPHVDRLQHLMRDWQQRSGDTLEIPTDDRQPPPIDLTGTARTPDQWQPAWIVRKYFDSPAAGPTGGAQ